MASSAKPEQNRPMDPVTLTSERLLLRTVGPHDTDAVYDAVQDPDIQRWTTIPSPYLREHAAGFTEQMVPDGWADCSMFTFGVFLPRRRRTRRHARHHDALPGASARSASGRRRNTGATATSPRPPSPPPAGRSPTGDRPRRMAGRGRQHGLPRGRRTRRLHHRGHPPLRHQQQGRTPRLLGRLPAPVGPGPAVDSALPARSTPGLNSRRPPVPPARRPRQFSQLRARCQWHRLSCGP